MKLQTLIPYLIGAIVGVAAVVSCSDDATSPADAADAATTCDCPASEPPILDRIVTVRATVFAPANSGTNNVARCAAGGVALGGGCFLPNPASDVRLLESQADAVDPAGWDCHYENNTAVPVEVGAMVRCLNPAP